MGASENNLLQSGPSYVQSFRSLAPLGVTHIGMPATPARVWAAIEHARRAKHN
jgi:hypothetical protein